MKNEELEKKKIKQNKLNFMKNDELEKKKI